MILILHTNCIIYITKDLRPPTCRTLSIAYIFTRSLTTHVHDNKTCMLSLNTTHTPTLDRIHVRAQKKRHTHGATEDAARCVREKERKER